MLVGFCGAVKTSVANALSMEFKNAAFNLDWLVEEIAGVPPAVVFERWGEAVFRQFEHLALARLCSEENSGIIATGSGTMLHSRNRQLVASFGMAIYLEASFKTLHGRLMATLGADNQHPAAVLARSNEKVLEHIYRYRIPYYRAVASKTIKTDGLDIETTAKMLGKQCGGRFSC